MSPANDYSRSQISDQIVIGKDILGLLTSAMYADPMAIYREYIQNAVDSIDEAIEQNLYGARSIPPIEITINLTERTAIIHDRGAGISKSSFRRRLASIGASKKRGTAARGFRGVGRLAGVGYCQELVMRTRAAGEEEISEMHWDGKRLKEILQESGDLPIDETLAQIVTVKAHPCSKRPKHFFEIEMKGLNRFKNDLFLNPSALEHSLGQVAPVPFNPDFDFGAEIAEFLTQFGRYRTYGITINGKEVFRPFRKTYEAKPGVHDRFRAPEFFKIPGHSQEFDAVGWILPSSYLGAIPDRHGISGLRLRVGNIQVGNSRILESLFAQPRFNSWIVGECHITCTKIIPNARRDDFEHNVHYTNLHTHLTPIAKKLLQICRQHSAERARQRKLAQNNGGTGLLNWSKTKAFLLKNATRPVAKRAKSSLTKKLQNGGITYSELIGLLMDQQPANRSSPGSS